MKCAAAMPEETVSLQTIVWRDWDSTHRIRKNLRGPVEVDPTHDRLEAYGNLISLTQPLPKGEELG